MTVIDQLRQRLEGLGLTAIDARLEALLEQAAKAEPAYADFLLDVVNAEADAGAGATSRRVCNSRTCPT